MIRTRPMTLLLLAACLVAAPPAPGRGDTEAERLADQRRESETGIQNAERELARIEAELRRLRQASRSNQTRLRESELELRKAVEVLKIQQGRVTAMRRDVEKLSGEIRETGQNIEKDRRQLTRRARALMNLSRLEKMEFLLRAGDAVELELRSRMLAAVAEADIGLIRRTIARKNALEAMKQNKQKLLAQLVDEERRLATAKNNVQARKRELERVQAELNRQTASQEEARRRTRAMLTQIRTRLASIQERLRAISSRRAAPTRFAAPSSGAYFRPEGVTLPGVYIRARAGSPVKVMAEGEVVSIQSMHGMGQTVIVGHGGNLTSVYANLSAVSVTAGQSVNRGESIGRSGTSPYGEAVYFAVYRNGAAQDPVPYLQ